MVWSMGKGSINLLMELNMKVIYDMISFMEKEL